MGTNQGLIPDSIMAVVYDMDRRMVAAEAEWARRVDEWDNHTGPVTIPVWQGAGDVSA